MKLVLENQDHTLGNIIQKYLNKHSDVIFAAYSVNHPLSQRPLITIQFSCKDKEKEKTIWKEILNQILEDIDFLEKNVK